MTASRQVIVVEDDRDFRESMVEYLVLNGLDVTGVKSALEFYQSMSQHKYDLAILDIGLPDQNGLVLAEYIRNNTGMRIMMLTAQSSLENKINAYKVGADIYLVKPIDFSELSASIFSMLGRLEVNQSLLQSEKIDEPALENKKPQWRLLRNNRRLYFPTGEEVKLTSKEFDLVERPALSSNTLVLRPDLVKCLGYENNDQGNRSLDSLVHRLRLKQDDTKYNIPVKTVHGSGYIFSAPITIV